MEKVMYQGNAWGCPLIVQYLTQYTTSLCPIYDIDEVSLLSDEEHQHDYREKETDGLA